MENDKTDIEIDPDYEINNSAIRKAEQNQTGDNRETVEKIRQIIKEEFDKDLAVRRKQLESIEEQIGKASKLLHLVRYALVRDYYYKHSLLAESNDDIMNESSIFLDGQNRIHPAVKKLLGNNNSLQMFNRSKRKPKPVLIPEKEPCSSTVTSKSEEPPPKKIKIEDIKELLQPKVLTNSSNVRNRERVKKRIIIGNISKYMPSTENDHLTHKWMIYVRSPKECPDVSTFIDRVVFYLHPSYTPHHVVEVNESPFHLSRRGWGEFSIRLKIFFKNPLNKPITLVHDLKLDKRCTGRQLLGNESITDVYLTDDIVENETLTNTTYTANDSLPDIFLHNDTIENCIKEEIVDIDNINLDKDILTSYEHDHCFGDSELLNCNNNEHSYSLHPSLEGINIKKEKSEVYNDPNNSLIHGLESYLSNEIPVKLKKQSPVSEKKIVLNNIDLKNKGSSLVKVKNSAGTDVYLLTNNVNLSNGNVYLIKNKNQQKQTLKNVPNIVSKIDRNEFKIKIPEGKFKNMGQVLPYLFKQLPLWSDKSQNLNYKCTYPFTANSAKDFASYNVGKKLSAEWSRAKEIKKILQEVKFFNCDKWNTKSLVMYGRSHLYTPLKSNQFFKYDSEEKTLLLKCYQDSVKLNKPDKSLEADINVDIESEIASPTKKNFTEETVDISDPSLKPQCSFIRNIALDMGIVLKPEEIYPNVIYNCAERVILEATKCFTENLIRRANFHRIYSGEEENSEITSQHLQRVLNEREELQSMIKFAKQKEEYDFFK